MRSLATFRRDLYRGTAQMFGRATAKRATDGWRAAFREHPEIAEDLIRLSGGMDLNQDADGNPLSDAVLRERAAQADLVRAIFARAELTNDEIRKATEVIGNEHVSAQNDGFDSTD